MLKLETHSVLIVRCHGRLFHDAAVVTLAAVLWITLLANSYGITVSQLDLAKNQLHHRGE